MMVAGRHKRNDRATLAGCGVYCGNCIQPISNKVVGFIEFFCALRQHQHRDLSKYEGSGHQITLP
jgi:hypothetical protein